MSKKDGKTVLLKSRDRKGFHTLTTNVIHEYGAEQSKKACPVNIISVKTI
jgi:ferredoxin